ncbi:MAG TPA: hypothetical protein PKY59_06485 [Pyrinomonadaceae bacterium]|nr:hypothetical protein [Pyrinomonadaceae bacterium]
MTVREEIIAKVQNLPENVLPEIYEFVEKIAEQESKPSLMERLRKIKIQAPPDFSRNIDLYMSGEKKIDENID